jgi:hypothetical protein
LNHSAGHVYRTTNGGQTWSNITSNLPSEPSFSLAVTSKGPADSDKVLYVGNDTGVYATCNMGLVWSRVSTGLPNAHVTHVEALSNLNVLAAGTYGRGLWELQIGVVAQIQVQGGTLNISGDDCNNVITIQASPTGGGLNVWEGNSMTPYYHLVGFFPAGSFNQIVLNDGNGDDTINIEDTLSGEPLTVNMGSGVDTINVSPFAHNLDHIQGNVNVNGGNGYDTLNINDQTKTTNLTYSLTGTTWSRPGAALIQSGPLFAAVNRVVVNAGSGADIYNIGNTTANTTLNTGPGQGTVNVQGTASPLTVDTPTGTINSSQTVVVGNAGSVQAIVGINNRGEIVGGYLDTDFNEHAYLLSGGQYTTIDPPDSSGFVAEADGINARGQIVGSYLDSNFNLDGFLLSGGQYTTLDDPSAGGNGTLAQGINAFGKVAGSYLDANGSFHGFLLHSGQYTTLDDPDGGSGPSQGTQAFGRWPNASLRLASRYAQSMPSVPNELPEPLHLGPQLLPALALGVRQSAEGVRLAHPCQIRIRSPMVQSLPHRSPGWGRSLRLLRPACQLRPQPVQGLLPQPGTIPLIRLGRILAAAAAGQGGHAGGVVAVAGF